MGGWSLYAKDGQLTYCYNLLGIRSYFIRGERVIAAGSHEVRAEFAYDGGGVGKGGTMTLLVDGTRVGEGRIDRTIPYQYSFDETMDVGLETGSPVSSDYGADGNAFSGAVNWVKLEIDVAAPETHIDAAHRVHAAMVRQ